MAHSGGVLISIFQGFSGSIGKFFALAGGGGGGGGGRLGTGVSFYEV